MKALFALSGLFLCLTNIGLIEIEMYREKKNTIKIVRDDFFKFKYLLNIS